MKKLFAILFAAIFVLALSACGATNSGRSNDGMQSSNGNGTMSQPAENSTPSANNQQAQQSAQSDPKLTSDEALDIALNQAGVTRDSIRDLENKLDLENGVLVYEIDFESGNTEYSYDINADTGAIVERDRDRED